MKNDVAQVMFGGFRVGGIPTYAYHLQKSFESIGVGAGTYSNVDKYFLTKQLRWSSKGGGDLFDRLKKYKWILLNGGFIDNAKIKEVAANFKRLRKKHGCKIGFIVHGAGEPTRITELFDFEKIITISKYNADYFKEKFGRDVNYTIHPYCRWSWNKRNKRFLGQKRNFISTARMNYGKHYERLILAWKRGYIPNYKIYADRQVCRPYVFFTLKKYLPNDWKQFMEHTHPLLRGGFYCDFKNIASALDKAIGMFDIATVKNDGYRSSYTILEAMDFGAVPILNRKWDPSGILWRHKENCIMVRPESLKSIKIAVRTILKKPKLRKWIIENNYEMLDKHKPEKIAGRFVKILGL